VSWNNINIDFPVRLYDLVLLKWLGSDSNQNIGKGVGIFVVKLVVNTLTLSFKDFNSYE
jgi:hypothetical protein